jgi:hypothetical protein
MCDLLGEHLSARRVLAISALVGMLNSHLVKASASWLSSSRARTRLCDEAILW